MRKVWPLTVRGTGAGALSIVCFVLAAELGVTELTYFGVLLAAVVLASLAAVSLTRRTDTVVRTIRPEVVHVGEESTVVTRVGVRTAVPTPPGTWHDTLGSGLSGTPEGVLPAIGSAMRNGQRTVEFRYTARGTSRGIHTIGPLFIRTSDPFGLAVRRTRFDSRTTVTVAPAVVDLPALTQYTGDSGGLLHSTTHHLGQGADNLVARPYATGDSMRRIHWRATAHRDTLMVRQEEQESTPEATVVLDRGGERWARDARYAPGRDPGFEAAVSACVSVVTRLVRDGYAVEVIDSDAAVLAERIDGGDLTEVDEMLTHFASLTARREDDLSQVSRLFAGSSTGPVIVITGALSRADAAALTPLAHHSSFPVLFAVTPSEGALEDAAASGWHAAPIDIDGDFADTWRATATPGATHVVA
ncbi:DUF58 domain-containing protein [Microbacterium sp. C7(2022)]|uniref:DUF58 domain-containing protein n=1 Tax=Microbacterium sp. C7(2022) TaxID=2992759 RepID=UPI00237A4E01|nr:DUF58 domain-containing protein [Microbacterium sp. C7(2022)]MDE0546033.1 DUF58 domain-containing protein [Microbacterium sp. C7(2022)]